MANKYIKKERENSIKRRKKGFVTKNSGRLLFFRTRSNYFLILSDLENKCIFCSTSGIAKIGTKKKQKISKQNILKLVQSIVPYLKLYEIKGLKLYVRCKVSQVIFHLINAINIWGYDIKDCIRIIYTPHNGVRARKIRRI